jgi:hypothetical protein
MEKLIKRILKEIREENYLENDAIGYNIGDYLYHITPTDNLIEIKQKGFIPKDGIAINGKPFKNRLYFATSLIAAYDLSVNFSSYRDTYDYTILKINSNCIDEYNEDPLFVHGIYVDYPISNDCIINIISADDLFGKFNDEDLENLYM